MRRSWWYIFATKSKSITSSIMAAAISPWKRYRWLLMLDWTVARVRNTLALYDLWGCRSDIDIDGGCLGGCLGGLQSLGKLGVFSTGSAATRTLVYVQVLMPTIEVNEGYLDTMDQRQEHLFWLRRAYRVLSRWPLLTQDHFMDVSGRLPSFPNKPQHQTNHVSI